MGYLANGEWFTDGAMPSSSSGRFVRKASAFRNWVTEDGAPGPTGRGGFKAEPGRYHLIVSYACPWAHRTMIFRKLKKLEEVVSLNAVEPLMLENGWTFAEPDPVTGAETAWQVYVKADPAYSGRATVPILWDRETGTIVSNESAEIIRMFNSAFDAWGDSSLDFYPRDLRAEIDEINTLIYDTVNNGVYKSGFAKSQDAHEEAVRALFDTLDYLEDQLSQKRYLMGSRLTEADWRLFTTLLRFDPVYHGHFKCNIRRIVDYPNLHGYLRELYQVTGIAETVDFDVIKKHYYGSHESLNPSGIVPIGPDIDLTIPHQRQKLAA